MAFGSITLSSTVRLLTALAGLAVSIAIGAGFFGSFAPALDSLSHFRLHLSVCALVLTLGLLRTRWRPLALFPAAACIAALATALPFVLPFTSDAAATGRARYTLLQMNVLYKTGNHIPALQRIADEAPDIVTLQEMNHEWRQALAPLEAAYPYQLHCEGADGHWGDAAILSKRPFAATEPPVCDARNSLAIAAVDLNGVAVTVVSHHQLWPWPFGQWDRFERIRATLGELPHPLILAGDFNAVPWSAVVGAYEEALGARLVRGIGGTWLTSLLPVELARIVGLPIDNVMATPEIAVAQARTMEGTASDHLPVLVTFTVAPPAEPANTNAVVLATVQPPVARLNAGRSVARAR